jgi:hypothetical protein
MRGVLDRAIRELREETAVEADGAITRQRIEAAWLRRRARARSLRRLTASATLLLLMGGGAWAATLLVQRRMVGLPKGAGSVSLEKPPAAGRPGRPHSSPPSQPPVLSPALPTPPPAPSPRSSSAPAPTKEPVSKRAVRAGGRQAQSVDEVPAARAGADLEQSPSEVSTTAYAAAHRAHFIDRDWPRALELWNRYLALAPTGALVPEAHFNRAICLLRLARGREAAAELQPFAAGMWGGYRQSEAAQLLAAMPKP